MRQACTSILYQSLSDSLPVIFPHHKELLGSQLVFPSKIEKITER
jgi:hypothetical protein